jgi:hypothetical protein
MNIGRYLRGEDLHVGTSRITKPKELKMNKRIKELKQQARDFYLAQEDLDCSITELHELVDAKFAELIIRECIDRVSAQFVHVRNNHPGVLRRQDIHNFEIGSVMADTYNRTQREQGIIECGVNSTEALYELILDKEDYDEEDEENYDK